MPQPVPRHPPRARRSPRSTLTPPRITPVSLRSPPRSSTMRWPRCPPCGKPAPATWRSIPRPSVAGCAPRSPPQPTSGTSYVDVRTGSELAQQAIEGGTLVEIEADAFGVVEIGERQTDAPSQQGARSTSPDAPGSRRRLRSRPGERCRRRLRVGERGPTCRTVRGRRDHAAPRQGASSGGRQAGSSGQRVPSLRGPTNRVRRLEHRSVHQRPAVVSRAG